MRDSAVNVPGSSTDDIHCLIGGFAGSSSSVLQGTGAMRYPAAGRLLMLLVWVALLLANPVSAIAQSTVVRADGGEHSALGVGDVISLSPPQAREIAQLKLVERPGYRTPMHVHERTDESFYVLEGTLTFHANGKTVVAGKGDYIFIPRGTPHAQGNATASDTILLTTLVPGDFAAFFEARAELVLTVPPDHPDYGARMRDLGKNHDIRVLGPAPF